LFRSWAWTGINTGVQATAYPNEALNFYKFYGYNNANFDNGNTKTNTMYWILTRIYNPVGITQIGSEIPERFTLEQNYPNPFNPATNIKFSIPKGSFVKLAVYDMLGREVAKLVNSELQAGTYNYDFDGSKLSSGVYFYKLESNSFSETKKMMLIK